MKHSKSVLFFVTLATALPLSDAFAGDGLITIPTPPPVTTPPAFCPNRFANAGTISVSQLYSRHAFNGCTIQVMPTPSEDGFRRTFITSQSGSLLITNFLGNGRPSSSTGNRAYYFFPRREVPSFEVLSTDEVALRISAGQILRINPETGRINGFSNVELTEDASINRNNNGGVEITRFNAGIMLDCGWKLGGNACANRGNATSVFRDPNNQTCSVLNRELFDSIDPLHFKFEDDASLAAFLERRCPNLDLTSLRPAPAAVTETPAAIEAPAAIETPTVTTEETPSAGAALPAEAPIEAQPYQQ